MTNDEIYEWRAEGTIDYRRCTRINKVRSSMPNKNSLNKIHLCDEIKKVIGLRPDLILPGNLFVQTPIQGLKWSIMAQVPEWKGTAQELAKKINRFCGWLKNLPGKYKALSGEKNKFISGVSHFGYEAGAGSSYEPNWWGIFEKHPSPGSLVGFRQLVWKTASHILKPMGLTPCKGTSKEAFFPVLLADGSRNPRRAGFQWAAATILLSGTGRWEVLSTRMFPTSRQAKEVLTRFAKNKLGNLRQRAVVACFQNDISSYIYDDTDGVECIRGERSVAVKFGMEIYPYITTEGVTGDLVIWGNRSYHVGCDIESMGTLHTQNRMNGIRAVIIEALNAWKRQDEVRQLAQRKEEDILNELGAQGPAEVVVLYADSRRAGNCHDGTVSWTKRIFGKVRYAIPLSDLLQWGDDYNVKNVLNVI